MTYVLCALVAWLIIGGGILAATVRSHPFEDWLFSECDRGGNADGWWTTTAKFPARLFAYPVLLAGIAATIAIGIVVGADLTAWGRNDR